MKSHMVQFSAVVVGNVHNPSILSPAFLESEEIVSLAKGCEVAENLTTPAFAMVRYTDGISITVEPNKLQVMDVGAGEEPTGRKATAIASAYAIRLPHVRYSGVGMNYQSFIEHEASDSYLKERFLKPGGWDNSSGPLKAVGLRLVYPLEDGGRVTLSLDAGEVERSNDEGRYQAVIARANFHRDCTEHPAAEQIQDIFRRLEDDWSMYSKLLKDAVGCEE